MPMIFSSPNVYTYLVREVLKEGMYRYQSFQPSKKNTNKRQDFAMYISLKNGMGVDSINPISKIRVVAISILC